VTKSSVVSVFGVKKHEVLALMNNLVRCGNNAQQLMQKSAYVPKQKISA